MPVVVRPRREGDVARLVEVLLEQQPTSGYPFRWPLPFPAEQFVVRESEEIAFVAEVDGVVVGQVAVLGVPDDDFADLWVTELGRPREELALVASFFVEPGRRGQGVGRRLLEEAVAWIVERDRTPVLDVLPSHERALALYERAGWRTLGRAHPPWLPAGEPPVLLMALD